jgi:preprotein translocase subunit SecG
MIYIESILKVLVIGLLLGAGLPAVFAGGLVAYSSGSGGQNADGSTVAPNPMMKFLGVALFVFVGWVIVTAVLWITRATIIHHTGIDLFPFMPEK